MSMNWDPETCFSKEGSSLSYKPHYSSFLLERETNENPRKQGVNSGNHENMQFKSSVVCSMLD